MGKAGSVILAIHFDRLKKALSYMQPIWLSGSMTDSPDPFVFELVPVRVRRDGWTAERQRVFIAVLRRTRSTTRAARAAGMSREGAYALRYKPGAASFAAAWDAACPGPAPLPTRTLDAHIEGSQHHDRPCSTDIL